jgi:hypothetical protein
LVLVRGISRYGVAMVAYRVETISRNSGIGIATLVIVARSLALVWWSRASKPTGFSKLVSSRPILSALSFIIPTNLSTLPSPTCSARAYAASSPEEIMDAIRSSPALSLSPGTRPTLL